MKPKFDHKVIRPKPWVPANQTDVSKTFARIKKEQQQIRDEQKDKVKTLNWRTG